MGLPVELPKIAQLLGLHIDILLMKVQKFMAEGSIHGSLDLQKEIFSPNSMIDNNQGDSTSNSLKTSHIQSISEVKQKDFIKAKTKETSQEDLIRLEVHLSYTGSNIRIALSISNNSDKSITEVTIKLIYSETLEFSHVTPEFESSILSSGLSINLPNLMSNSKTSLKIYFKSETLGMGSIKGQLQYVNYQDFVRFIRIEPLYYDLNPPSIIPLNVSKLTLENFSKMDGLKKDIRSYGLPDNINPKVVFNHIMSIIEHYNFQLISKIEEKDQYIAWYFGQTTDKENNIMVVGQIVNKKIEFYASGFKEQLLSALLTGFSVNIKKRLVNSRAVESEDEIYELYCKKCGGVLPYFPKPAEPIKCKWCGQVNLVR